MKIKICKNTKIYESNTKFDFAINYGNSIKLIFFGKPILYNDKSFVETEIETNETYESLIPKLTGQFLCLKIENGEVLRFSVDFYGHSRIYLFDNDKDLYLVDSLSELSGLDFHPKYDYYQMIIFLTKGYTWNGGTFFENISIVSPSKDYFFVNNRLDSYHLKLPKIKKYKNLKQSVSEVLKGLSDYNKGKELALMFSGGKDSSFLALLLQKKGLRYRALFSKNINPRFSLSMQDSIISSLVAQKKGLNYTEIDLDVVDTLKKTLFDTIDLLPFDFHISDIPLSLINYAKNNDYEMIITGQNADSLYNYGFTGYYSLFKVVVKLMIGKLKYGEYNFMVNRYFQTDKVLNSILQNDPNKFTIWLWNKFNPSVQLTLENILNCFIFPGSSTLEMQWSNMESITSIEGASHCYEKNKQEASMLIKLIENGTVGNIRELLLRTKLLGHCQGRDVRCITEWSKSKQINNCQVFSTAPVFISLARMNNTLKDVRYPKYQIYRFLKNKVNYRKLEQIMEKSDLGPIDCSNEKEYFATVFKSIETEKIEYYVNKALTILSASSLIDSQKIRNKCDNDIVFKFSVSWMGVTLSKFENTNTNL